MKTKHQFLKSLIIFLTGYCMYIATEITARGVSYILMGIVGGLAFLLISSLNNKLSWDIPLLVQMTIGGLAITAFEFLAGLLDKYLLLKGMWDYSNLPGNILGIVCPQFTLLWVLLSFIPIVLSDAICYYAFHENPRPYYKSLSGKILFQLPKRECS